MELIEIGEAPEDAAPVSSGGASRDHPTENPLFPEGTQGVANTRDTESCPTRARTFAKTSWKTMGFQKGTENPAHIERFRPIFFGW